jgi:hypothetical protein
MNVKHKKTIIIAAALVGTLGILACSGAASKDKSSSNGGLGAGTGAGTSPAASAPASQAAPTKDPNGFGEGTYQVGKEIKAGVYTAAVPNGSADCYIEVSKDDSGSFDAIISNDNLSPGAHALVTVADGQFIKTSGCGDWSPAPATGAQSTTFTEGIFRAGIEIAPGSYTATVPADSSNCYVEVSKDGTGVFSSIVANDNFDTGAHARVSVKAGQWLKTDGCGTWTKQ